MHARTTDNWEPLNRRHSHRSRKFHQSAVARLMENWLAQTNGVEFVAIVCLLLAGFAVIVPACRAGHEASCRLE